MKPIHRVAIALTMAAALAIAIVSGGYRVLMGTSQPDIVDDALPGIVFGKDTPVRVGRLGTSLGSFARSYTFAEAYLEADLVAEVVITEWLGELDREFFAEVTYFRGKVLSVFYDRLGFTSDELVLLQLGNSKHTCEGYPLFRNGDRLLLCLKALDDDLDSVFIIKGEDCFGIVGSQMTELLIIEKDGDKYALKRNLHENFTDIETIRETDAAEVIEKALKQDPIMSKSAAAAEYWKELGYVYALDDLTNYMDNLRRSDGNE